MLYDIELFKAGTQISAAGQQKAWTTADLQELVSTFQQDTVPLIIGHNQTDTTPAVGWLKRVWIKGTSLWGQVRLTPEMDSAVTKGLWRKISIGLYDKLSRLNPMAGRYKLRHVAFVHIPAIKNLDLTAFPNFNETNLDFEEYTMTTFLDQLIEDAINFGEQDDVSQMLDEISEALDNPEVIEEEIADDEIDVLETAEPSEVAEEVPSEVQQELESLRALVLAQAEAMQRGEMLKFTEKLFTEGRLLPRQVNQSELVDFMMSLNPVDAELSFSEKSVTQLEMFQGILQKLPVQITFGEKVMTTENPEVVNMSPREKMHYMAKKMQKETGKSYTECVKSVMKSQG